MRVYIAGPMTGLPEYNYPAFHAAAAEWRAGGHDVLNPAVKFGGRTDLPYEVYLRACVPEVMVCEAIVLLPGWESSRGVAIELAVAEALGLAVYYPGDPIAG